MEPGCGQKVLGRTKYCEKPFKAISEGVWPRKQAHHQESLLRNIEQVPRMHVHSGRKQIERPPLVAAGPWDPEDRIPPGLGLEPIAGSARQNLVEPLQITPNPVQDVALHTVTKL